MFFIIYKIINKINNKEYIGKHKTINVNDGYMGSGTAIKKAIQKYGKKNFHKEILFIFTNEELMNEKEKELVTEEYCNSYYTYNMSVGGKGGFSYINRQGLNNTDEVKKKKSETLQKYWTDNKKKQKSKDMIEYNKINGKDRYVSATKSRYNNQDFKKKFDEKMSSVNKNIEKRNRAGESIKKLWESDLEFQNKMKNRKRGSNSESLKEKWKNPVWRNMMLEKRKKSETNEN